MHFVMVGSEPNSTRSSTMDDREANKHQHSSYLMVIWYYFRINILRVAVKSPAVSV